WDSRGRVTRNGAGAPSGPPEARLATAAVEPLVEAALRLVAAVTVALLDAPDELVVVALGHRQVVVGELAPLLLDVALELLPVALQDVPVHVVLPLEVMSGRSARGLERRRGRSRLLRRS